MVVLGQAYPVYGCFTAKGAFAAVLRLEARAFVRLFCGALPHPNESHR